MMFTEVSLNQFLPRMESSYSSVAEECLRMLLPFTTTYLCKPGFSTVMILKTKLRNRHEVAHGIRSALSQTEP